MALVCSNNQLGEAFGNSLPKHCKWLTIVIIFNLKCDSISFLCKLTIYVLIGPTIVIVVMMDYSMLSNHSVWGSYTNWILKHYGQRSYIIWYVITPDFSNSFTRSSIEFMRTKTHYSFNAKTGLYSCTSQCIACLLVDIKYKYSTGLSLCDKRHQGVANQYFRKVT